MNAQSIIDVELSNWKETENKYRQQHGDGVLHDRKFLQEKLKALRGIYNRNRGATGKEAKVDLKILKSQTRALEKQLYSPAQLRMLQFGRAVAAVVRVVAAPVALLGSMAWKKGVPVLQKKVEQWRSAKKQPAPLTDQDIARQIQGGQHTYNKVEGQPARSIIFERARVEPVRKQRLFRIDPGRKGRRMGH